MRTAGWIGQKKLPTTSVMVLMSVPPPAAVSSADFTSLKTLDMLTFADG